MATSRNVNHPLRKDAVYVYNVTSAPPLTKGVLYH